MNPYFSIDIETTGLDSEQDSIIEIGCVYDDGIKPVQELPRFSTVVYYKRLSGSTTALSMNSKIIDEIVNTDVDKRVTIRQAIGKLDNFIKEHASSSESVWLAGKNLATFDLKFLHGVGFGTRYKHRVMDVGNMYYTKFGYVPGLNEINKLINYDPVSHRALSDAINVVVAIRYIIGEKGGV